mmetsp:Transcript_5418/g.16349  ORF Transcript_5418/g.16349 Transcript_5418/m.16349 type:complete len:383 (-) Transcript_5418:1545-2693(-)
MESVQGHLCGRLSDGLGGDDPDRVSGARQGALQLCVHQPPKRPLVCGPILLCALALPFLGLPVPGGLLSVLCISVPRLRKPLQTALFLATPHAGSPEIQGLLQFLGQWHAVLYEKVELIQVGFLCGVHAVLTIPELHDAAVLVLDASASASPSCRLFWLEVAPAVPHGAVVLDGERLQGLHETPLQVPRPSGLHGCIHQSLPSSHAVEVVLLGLETSEEAVRNEAAAPGFNRVGQEARQGLSGLHPRHPPTLQGLLPQQNADLRVVDHGPLGPAACHHVEVVLGELLGAAGRQARVHCNAADRIEGSGAHRIKLGTEGLLVVPEELLPQILLQGLVPLRGRRLRAPASRGVLHSKQILCSRAHVVCLLQQGLLPAPLALVVQ